jgi:hypothetical protein
MGASLVIRGLSELALFFLLFMILQVPAFASGPTITMTTPSDPVVNTYYDINIYMSDGADPLMHQTVILDVTSPGWLRDDLLFGRDQ